MKKMLSFLFLLNWLLSAKAQTHWEMTDTALSVIDANFTFITIDKNNTPYVIYRDVITGGRATVKKYDGNHWVTVGNAGFSVGGVYCTTMAFDKMGTPYVAYTDWAYNKKATVMKFNGSNWVTVGIAGFTPFMASFTSIEIDTNETPYITFRDLQYDYRASVMKFDGSNWIYVGTPGFSTVGGSADGAGYTSISFDKNNNPYVAYSDLANNFRATVQKFDGNNWVYVGAHGFANWNATYTKSMAFDKNGTAYIVCSVGSKATVMKFDGNNWIAVGSPGFSQGFAEYASIAMDVNDTIYVAYKDWANGKKATVMKFDGTNWLNVGVAGFSPADVFDATLAIDKLGNLYVAFKDGTPHYYGEFAHYRAVVMKYGNNVTEIKDPLSNISFSIYPNPTGDIFNIEYVNYKATGSLQLTVASIQGKIVYKESINDFNGKLNKQINLHNIAKGTYFVELNSDKTQEMKKIIVE